MDQLYSLELVSAGRVACRLEICRKQRYMNLYLYDEKYYECLIIYPANTLNRNVLYVYSRDCFNNYKKKHILAKCDGVHTKLFTILIPDGVCGTEKMELIFEDISADVSHLPNKIIYAMNALKLAACMKTSFEDLLRIV